MSAITKYLNPVLYGRAIRFLYRYGPKYFWLTYCTRFGKYDRVYEEWDRQHALSKADLQKQRDTKFNYSPKISIVVPTYNTPQNFLEEMIQSVLAQTYPNWELCIADGASTNKATINTLKNYEQKDKRIIVKFLTKNGGISENTNAALAEVNGDYVSFLDHDDILAPNALYEAIQALQNTKHDFMYSDEDMVSSDNTRKINPVFKPNFSPQLLECHNYITHMVFVSRELYNKVGKLNKKYDGAQDYDFVFRCTEVAKSIYHIPYILYHWRCHEQSTAGNTDSKTYAYDAGRNALQDHFERIGADVEIKNTDKPAYYHPVYKTPGNPLVSIIIPNMDHLDMLKPCINSLFNNNSYKNFEVLVIENNSKKDDTFAYYNQLEKQHKNARVLHYIGDFNYSKINNWAVQQAKGDYLLFLNNDTETINDDAIAEMLGMCMRPKVGIVGAKLFYKNDTVQHSGVIIGFNGTAGHIFMFFKKDTAGYMNRALINCNYSAVTAACMIVSKQDFMNVGGFDESFVVALNDVDLCLKMNAAGKYVACNNFSHWHHYESVSRGIDNKDPQKKERYDNESAKLREKWPDIFEHGDPYYNPNYTFKRGAYSLTV